TTCLQIGKQVVGTECFEPWALEVAGSNPADPTIHALHSPLLYVGKGKGRSNRIEEGEGE
ncbi:MAG: hypothetical protein QW560_04855, partial [Candidatus Nitrosocaldus sp.]